MDKVNIGFMGGCIHNQSGIRRDDLYHAVATRLLRQHQPACEYGVSLGCYLSFDQLVSQAQHFITRKRPDILFLFIRPFPLMPLQKLVVRFEKPDGTGGMGLHPALFGRQLAWNDQFTRDQTERPFVYVPRSRIGFRDLNLLGGILLGLHHWARRYVAQQLLEVEQLCSRHQVRLKVISPPQRAESVIARATCKWFAGFLDRYCRRRGLDFINIQSLPDDHLEQDQIHFNTKGHQQLGQLLFADLTGALISSSCRQYD